MKVHLVAALCALAIALTSQVQAQNILSPTDFILGGERVGDQFVVGTAGTAANTNNWPANESPDHAIDGVGQKYLNFGREDTGILVTPGIGSSVVSNITFWTANDAEPRDPASFELWGTNSPISGMGPFELSDFSLIASGDLALPSSRNPGGTAMLLDTNSQMVSFSNSSAYASYLVLFPTVKNGADANSMQLAEIQLGVPEPTTLGLVLVLAGLAITRWRR